MATHDNWTYEKLTKENVEECFQWLVCGGKGQGCDDDEDKNEMCVTLNSLRLFQVGVVEIVRVDGRIVLVAEVENQFVKIRLLCILRRHLQMWMELIQ